MEPRKRPASEGEQAVPPTGKRQRTGSLHTIEFMAGALPTAQDAADGHEVPSMDEQAHDVLRRSLVLALRQVGFASATRDALEVFTTMVETCELAASGRW